MVRVTRTSLPSPQRRVARALALTVAPALLLVGCTGHGGSPLPAPASGAGKDPGLSQAATALAAALTKQDVSSLTWSGLTGAQAQTNWQNTTAPLGRAQVAATTTTVQSSGDTGSVTLELSWTFPGVPQSWSYPVTAGLTRVNGVWADVWATSLVQPELVDGAKLSLKRTQGKRGDILAGDGSALMSERDVARIGIDKTQVSGQAALTSATALAKLVDIDAKAYVAAVKGAGAQAFVQAIVFRAKSADQPSSSRLDKIKGAVAIDGTAVLSPSRGFALPLLGQVGEANKEEIDKSGSQVAAGDQVGLSGLEARDEAQLGGKPSVQVSVRPAAGPSASPDPGSSPSAGPSESASPSGSASSAGARVVFNATGKSGSDLKLTLSPRLQTLAEQALSKVKPDSALVAVQPSTGKILAAASGPGAAGANSATFGQYPPGSTFKLASSLALLRAGMKPGSAVDCPKTVKVNGQTFKNYVGYPSSHLGRIDLETAVAQSCNTAFIGSRDKLSGTDLADAAASLGIGTDYDVGFPAYYGSVPAPGSENEKAASMIGQAKVQASPMAMAGAVASIQQGRTVLPYLIDSEQPKSKAEQLTGTEAEQLRTMLGAVVSQGSGARLKALEPPNVIAKTGTAEFGTDNPPQTHAWMVAAQGDLAVAVFVGLGGSGSGTAGPILESFMKKS